MFIYLMIQISQSQVVEAVEAEVVTRMHPLAKVVRLMADAARDTPMMDMLESALVEAVAAAVAQNLDQEAMELAGVHISVSTFKEEAYELLYR